MKVPYVVSPTTREAYATSNTMKTSLGENSRKIRADDFEWDDDFTPAPLTYFAALQLSRMFHRLNPLGRILQKDNDMLMDLFPDDIPLKYSVPLIRDEQYWKRSMATKFPGRVELGVTFWKGKFLSVCLQDYMENVNPDVFIEEDATELAVLVSPYIYELGLNQLQMVRQPLPPIPQEDVVEDCCPFSVTKVFNHVPLEPVLVKLYNLQEISLVFGINNLMDSYKTRYFEFSMADCESLCRGLENLRHLKLFRINRSNLDCSKVKLILQNLVKQESIEELDFNHCKIGDYGMKALGGFIYCHNNVRRVRIANNRFKEVGVQGIAYALQMKPAAPIELLGWSKRITGAGANILKETNVKEMAGLLSLNRGLTRLDMAANDLSGEAEITLIKALEMNRNILRVDLRKTHISEETQAKVDELLLRNKNLVGVEREPSAEIPPLYLNEPEYLIWEYNPNNPDYIPGRYPKRIPQV